MAFEAEVTEQPARRLVGMKLRTTMGQTGVCYEYYPTNWNESAPLEVYAPVRRK